MNLLDKVILSISPESAHKRLVARKKVQFMQSYDGATKGRRSTGWKNNNTSANTEIRKAGATIMARARDLVRNDAWAARAKMVIVNNTVGTGIVPNIQGKSVAKAWKNWAEKPACDNEGMLDFYGIQDLVLNTVVESGECLIRRVYTMSRKGGLPIKLQVLEPDHIASYKDGTTETGGKILQGKEYSAAGELTHYWLYKEHPGDNYRTTLEVERIPAKDIIHVFKKERPGQQRGISWFSPIIVRMYDFSEYEDAQLVKQKISSKWAAFIYDGDMPTSTQIAQEMSDVIEAGAIEYLPPGKEITFPNMPSSGNYTEYAKMQLHAFAAAMGITYESLTGFYDDTNFASGRMGWVEMHRNIQVYRRKMLIPQLCRGVFQWFTEACIIAGVPTVDPVTVTWTPPRREMFDPVKETNADINEVQAGFMSWSEKVLSRGGNPQELAAQIAADNVLLDGANLKLKSDYRNELNDKGAVDNEKSAVPTKPEK